MEIEPKNQSRNFRSEKFVCSHFFAEWKTALSFIFGENHVFTEEENPQTKLTQSRKNKMELI